MESGEVETVSVGEFLCYEFDFIVVGGGTAGLAVASRLAEGGRFAVGVIEAGCHARNEETIDIPAYYGRSLGGQYDWKFETVPQPGLGGRALPWPRGKVLGGTSALNFMTWNRPSRDDYDAWEALGNVGWGWESMLPFFKKSETFHGPNEYLRSQYEVSHDPGAFGTSGPIQISYSEEYSESHALWHRTLNNLGIETNPAHVTGSNVGVWTNINAVDPRTAARCYATSYPARIGGTAKLHILCGASVERVVLRQDGGRVTATGVILTVNGKQHEASVSREVILSCGSIGSPHLLELSGIGKRSILEEAGIPQLVDSPMVGENLQEHLMLAMIFEVDSNLDNPDDLINDENAAREAREQYDRDRSGRLTILPCAICYVPLMRILSDESLSDLFERSGYTKADNEDKQKILQKRLDGHTNLGQVEYIFDLGNWNPYFSDLNGKKYGTLLQILQYPFSVGSIHVKPQAEEPNKTVADKPSIDPRYYEGAHGQLDFEVMKQSTRFAKKIISTAPLSDIIRGPSYPSASELDDESLLEKWIVENTITDWHPIGTCAMGGRGGVKDGVVDERLRAYGLNGLRVIDASTMPLQISAHPQATVYAIAEKGASMILEDHVRDDHK